MKATLVPILFGAGLLGAAPGCEAEPPSGPTVEPVVHRYASREAGIFANAYIVESAHGVVVVDATLTVSESTALRQQVDALEKPLRAVLLTHGHPDHYNGLTTLVGDREIPIIATAGVDAIIRRDDAAKDAQWRPVFGDEWPAVRTFPNRIVDDAASVSFDGMTFTVHALGPGESHEDAYWMLDGPTPTAFMGDVVFHDMHAYLSDGHSGAWVETLDALEQTLPADTLLYPGHGEPGGKELLAEQRTYLTTYRSTVDALAAGATTLSDAQKQTLVERMMDLLPTEALAFLIPLGADPVAAELASD